MGEDKAQLLYDITQAIGKTNIKKVNIDTQAHTFNGLLTLLLNNEFDINNIFVELFKIDGINSVEKLDKILN